MIEVKRVVKIQIGNHEFYLSTTEARQLLEQLQGILLPPKPEPKKADWVPTRRGFRKGTVSVSRETLEQLRRVFKEHPNTPLTSKQIVQLSGLHPSRVSIGLRYLLETGQLRRMKEGRQVKYLLRQQFIEELRPEEIQGRFTHLKSEKKAYEESRRSIY